MDFLELFVPPDVRPKFNVFRALSNWVRPGQGNRPGQCPNAPFRIRSNPSSCNIWGPFRPRRPMASDLSISVSFKISLLSYRHLKT
uniref:Uncharacterized protein n=1 Tax=Rhizophora mucronata TaxID=61149 RepID=A0A2P2QDP2_RHIMU